MPHIGGQLNAGKSGLLLSKSRPTTGETDANFQSVAIPEDVTIWSWLFDSPYASSRRAKWPRIGGFRDATTGQFVSFSQVQKLATQLSTSLVKVYGLRPGDGVCIFASNSTWYPIALFAAVRLGAVVTGSSPEYGPDEISHILRSSQAKLIFVDQGSLGSVTVAANGLKINQTNILLLESQPGSRDKPSAQGLIDKAHASMLAELIPAFKLAPGRSNKDVCAYLSFTSGTTSQPKGVSLSTVPF